jgi:hypothetical protein
MRGNITSGLDKVTLPWFSLRYVGLEMTDIEVRV